MVTPSVKARKSPKQHKLRLGYQSERERQIAFVKTTRGQIGRLLETAAIGPVRRNNRLVRDQIRIP